MLMPGTGTADEATVAANPTFSPLRAVADGNVLLSPMFPYGWFDGPPAVNQVLGTVWAAEAIYPDRYDFDVAAEVEDFYALFYHHELTDDEVAALLTGSGFDG